MPYLTNDTGGTPDEKQILPLALALVLALTIAAGAISPRWNSGAYVIPTFTLSGTTASCKLEVRAISTGHNISGTVILYKVNGDEYIKLTSWPVSGTGNTSFSKIYGSLSSGSYEMYYSITVSSSSGSDTITGIKTATKP